MSVLTLERVFQPPLQGVSLVFDPGLQVVLGAPGDGSETFSALASGRMPAREGEVRVLGADPARSPVTRARIAALCARETLAPGRTLRQALALSLSTLGLAPERALQELNLGGWAERRASSLCHEERRAVALSVALARADAALLILHEPLAAVAALDRALVLDRMQTRASEGVCVVVVTASVRDALELGGHLRVLESGRVRDTAGAPGALDLVPGGPVALAVRSPGARRLTARLSQEPAVEAIEYRASVSENELSVRGSDADALALAVMRCAREVGATIDAIVPSAPALELVRAASAGELRATFERAYQVTRGGEAVAPQTAGGAAGMGVGFPSWPAAPSAPAAAQAAPARALSEGAEAPRKTSSAGGELAGHVTPTAGPGEEGGRG